MHFTTVFVLASATLTFAFPPILQCSAVDCTTNLDCHDAGCYACDTTTGKCDSGVDGPIARAPPLPKCSAVDCSSSLDCQKAGCFGCDTAKGKCGASLVSSHANSRLPEEFDS